MNQLKKKCYHCKIEKDFSEFSPSQLKRSGSLCRLCNTQIARERREKNPNKNKEYQKKYGIQYYQKNKDKILKKKRQEYQIIHPPKSKKEKLIKLPKTPITIKTCGMCHIEKDISNFYPSTINAKYALCRECNRIAGKEFRRRNGANVDSRNDHKFTNLEVQKIIDLYKRGISCKKIGKQFNCSKQKINAVLKKYKITFRDQSHARQVYQVNENIFETIDTHEKAYWLGMLAGDGWISKGGSIGLSLQEKDKQFVYKFRDFLQSNHPITKKYNRQKKDGSDSISYTIVICNQKLVKDLNKHEIKKNKTYDMKFPATVPDQFLCSYMLGLVDSDGCFCLKTRNNGKKTLSFSFVAPPEFVKKYQEILIEKCGVSKTKIADTDKNIIQGVGYGGFQNIFKVVKFLYQHSPVWFERKKNIAINYLLTKYPDDEWLNQQIIK